MSDYGLAFLFDVEKDLVLNKEFISILYKVIGKVVKTKIRETVPIPEMPQPDADGNEPSEEDKASAQKRIEEAMKHNQEVERFNEEVMKMQSKIKVAIRPSVPEQGISEVGIMKVSNYRDIRTEDNTPLEIKKGEPGEPSSTTPEPNALENFNLEEISNKMILLDPKHSEDTHLIVYHNGK